MNNIDRIRALREGGHVRRCHTIPHFGEYTDGLHTFNAVSLLLCLHPDREAALRIVPILLWHDMAERWLGDLPAPAKWVAPGIRVPYEEAELKTLDSLGVPRPTPEQLVWVKAIDALEFWLWSVDQLEGFGNQNVLNAKIGIEKFIRGMDLPPEVQDFFNRYTWKRGQEIVDCSDDGGSLKETV